MEEDRNIKIIAAIIMILIFVGIISTSSQDTKDEQQKAPVQNTQTIQQKNVEIKRIEGFINDYIKAGIFMSVNDLGTSNGEKLLEIQVEETAWNNLPFDVKQATANMFMQYYSLARVQVYFRGYRTGQKLFNIAQNFD